MVESYVISALFFVLAHRRSSVIVQDIDLSSRSRFSRTYWSLVRAFRAQEVDSTIQVYPVQWICNVPSIRACHICVCNTNLAIIEIPAVALLPVGLMFVIFVICGIFGGLAGILTMRVMIDVVPNRIRNSMYSLKPTLILLVSIPLIVFFGWAIPIFGFPFTFTICAFIALFGALSIWKAFTYPIPKAEMVTTATEKEVADVEVLEVT